MMLQRTTGIWSWSVVFPRIPMPLVLTRQVSLLFLYPPALFLLPSGVGVGAVLNSHGTPRMSMFYTSSAAGLSHFSLPVWFTREIQELGGMISATAAYVLRGALYLTTTTKIILRNLWYISGSCWQWCLSYQMWPESYFSDQLWIFLKKCIFRLTK